jgi:hypothetical protein
MASLTVKGLNRKPDGYENGAQHWQIVILWLNPTGHIVLIDQWPAI